MEIVAALVPPVVMAIAFIAIARAALRHTDGSRRAGRRDESESPADGRGDRGRSDDHGSAYEDGAVGDAAGGADRAG